MGKFSSQEIESQYNLIKMLLAEPEKYKDAIDAIKKDIAYMPMELKKKLNKKYADLMRQAQQATGRKEAVGLIHKAAKLKNKFDQYEMM